MHILKKPDLSEPKMRVKLAKGMGHNYYGELGPHLGIREIRLLENVHRLVQVLREQ